MLLPAADAGCRVQDAWYRVHGTGAEYREWRTGSLLQDMGVQACVVQGVHGVVQGAEYREWRTGSLLHLTGRGDVSSAVEGVYHLVCTVLAYASWEIDVHTTRGVGVAVWAGGGGLLLWMRLERCVSCRLVR